MTEYRPGLIAWANPAVGLNPLTEHLFLVLRTYPTGLIHIAFITHSVDLFAVSVPLTRALIPTAFHPTGPMTSDHSVVGLLDHRRDPVHRCVTPCAGGLQAGSARMTVRGSVQLPAAEWSALRARILAVL